MAGCDRIWEDITRCVKCYPCFSRATETQVNIQQAGPGRQSDFSTCNRVVGLLHRLIRRSQGQKNLTGRTDPRSDPRRHRLRLHFQADWKSAAFTQLCSKACQKWQENTTNTPCLEISIDSMKHLCLFGGEPPRWIYAKHLQNEVSDLCKAGWTNLDDTFQHVQWTPLRPPPSMRLHPRPRSWMTQQGHGNAAICCNGAEASRLCKRST